MSCGTEPPAQLALSLGTRPQLSKKIIIYFNVADPNTLYRYLVPDQDP